MDLGFLTVFGAGLLTVLSPCVLPILPLYVSLLVGEGVDAVGKSGRRRLDLFVTSLFFFAGFLLVFSLLGLTASALGRSLVRHRDLLQQLGGLLVFTFGLKFLGWLHVERLEEERRVEAGRFRTRFKLLNAFLLGFFFAFGWTPCVGPILGSVLTYTAVSADNLFVGALYLLVYGLGLALPLLLLPLFFGPVLALLTRAKRWIPRIERATGVLLVVMGVLMITNNLTLLDAGVKPADQAEVHVVSSRGTADGQPAALLSCEAEGSTSCAFDPDDPSRPVEAFEPDHRLSAVRGKADIEALLAGKGSSPLFVEFYSSNCPMCRRMVPLIRAIEESCFEKDLQVLKINVSLKENAELARRFGVVGVPTFAFLKPDGTEVSRLIGYQTVSALERNLSALTAGECQGFVELPGL